MAKELSLYGSINSFSAEMCIAQINDCMNDDIDLRMYSGGGDVFAGWGIAAKMQEHGKVNIKVDGMAASMAAILLLFADSVECLDTSSFVLHRADGYVENDEDQAFLDSVNNTVREKMKARIDDAKLKELKGVGIKNIFEDAKRIDVVLSPKEAKAIGLVQKVTKLNPTEIKAFNQRMQIAAFITAEQIKKISPQAKTPEPIIQNPKITMTADKLKSEHPDVYNAIFNAGLAAEKDRVGAIMVFNEVDPVGVKAAIDAGKPLTQTQMSEFALKAMAHTMKVAVVKDSAGNVITDAPPANAETEEQKRQAGISAELKKYREAKKAKYGA